MDIRDSDIFFPQEYKVRKPEFITISKKYTALEVSRAA
jgi:hypothetical protein